MQFNDAELAVMASGTYSIGIFFRLETDPVVRLWMAHGSIEVGINAYDPSGATYTGFGELLAVPVVKQLLNGTAERVDFTLSGVSGEVLSKALGEAPTVKNKIVRVGFAFMSPPSWATIGEIHWFGKYVADFVQIDQAPADAADEITRVLTLSCSTRFTGRRRPAFSYYTDADQQARFPGDQSCEYVTLYAHGYNKQWPSF